jgi:hypothetical protein
MSKEVPVQRNENITNRSGSVTTGQNHNNYPMTANLGGTTMVHHPDTEDETIGPVEQEFSFWAPLMQYNDSIRSSLLLHYPPVAPPVVDGTPDWQPNRTNSNTTAWQSLNNTNLHFVNHPPILEFVD